MVRGFFAALVALSLLAAVEAAESPLTHLTADREPVPQAIRDTLHQRLAAAPGAEKVRDLDGVIDTWSDARGQMHVQVLLAPSEAMRLAPSQWSSEAWRAENRDRVEVLRGEVLAAHGGPGLTVTAEYRNIAGFGTWVDEAALEALLADPRVQAVEPTRIATRHDLQGHALIRANPPRVNYPGTGITIAIIDDGVDYTHPQLGGGGFPNAKVIGGIDTSGAGDADPRNPTGAHGTACAGIAAGDIAIVGDYRGGVAPDARIAAVKVFPDGTGSATFEDVNEGIDWCITNMNLDPAAPIKVISMSLGGGAFSSAASCDFNLPSTLALANAATAAGITVLASSGNNGFCDSMGAPACLSPIISVGAVYDANLGSRTWCVSDTTCFGNTAPAPGCGAGRLSATDTTTAARKVTAYSNSADFLDIMAPSNNAYTTDIVGTAGYSSGNFTTSFGGTSAACPYAAGAVAVLQHAHRTIQGRYLAPAEVRSYLVTTGEAITDTKAGGLDPARITPMVDLTAALAAIPPNQAPTALTISSLEVPENMPVNTIIGQFTTTDPDSHQTHTYTLLDPVPFVITGNRLRTATVLDFEAGPTSYTFEVRADDNGFPTGSITETFTVTILNVNEPATDIFVSALAVPENAPPGTEVGIISWDDPDGLGATFTLTAGADRFAIVPLSANTARLVTTVPLNYEASSSHAIVIEGTDDGSLLPVIEALSRPFTVTVLDVNDPPVVEASSLLAITLPLLGSAVIDEGILLVTDEDHPPAALEFSLLGGPLWGQLENTDTAQVIGGPVTFTMADVMAGHIRYVHTTGTPASDAFTLSVTDGEAVLAPAATITVAFLAGVPDWAVLD